eukprot:TRINITY_DN2636_c0_g1_i2.p1 TRINITY_DN2636_c0_g1~~TRINITY_DN2636_c0_g1_i2.p1  ORF type:complete len:1423 (+),score=460.75 TRINITY_DN2636_c0_g1_i2:227-4495(+)
MGVEHSKPTEEHPAPTSSALIARNSRDQPASNSGMQSSSGTTNAASNPTSPNSSGNRPRKLSKDFGMNSPYSTYSPHSSGNSTRDSGSGGHRRRKSDVEVEQRAARIKDIVAASKVTNNQKTIRKKKLDQQQEELEKTEESLRLEAQEEDRRRSSQSNVESPEPERFENESVISDSGNIRRGSATNEKLQNSNNSVVLNESASNSSNQLYLSARSSISSSGVREPTSSNENIRSFEKLKNKVYSYVENETDFSVESPASSRHGTPHTSRPPSRAPTPPLSQSTDSQPQSPRSEQSASSDGAPPNSPLSTASGTSSENTPEMVRSNSQVKLHHRKSRSQSNSVSFVEPTSKPANGGYTEVGEADFDLRESSGPTSSVYASSAAQIASTQSPQSDIEEEKREEARRAESRRREEESGFDDDIIAEEVINNLKQLTDEEKMNAASKLAFRHPTVMRELRDQLRTAMKDKQNQRIVQYTQSPNEINWNARFQTLIEDLRTCEDTKGRMEIYSNLSKLAQDFIYCAKTYGKLIISEVYAPFEEKTIKPIAVGGQLGGLKYVVKNILFKFAVDQYGLFQSDEHAAKVAGHDLKGLIQYFDLGIPGLHFPLMALVDYVGFRLQALSLLPINAETLIYGTGDGGRTVKAENPKFNAKMRLAGEKLNLKPHQVGLSKTHGKFLYSCADIEGHHGFDGRYYAIDFSRSFPPMDPDKSNKNAHLFRLFRPEFVKKYETPLCPDAFSGFVANYQAEEHIKQIREATDYLYNKVIPEFASELNAIPNEELETISIKHALHKKGINLCLMGVLRQQLDENSVFQKRLLIEMIARTNYHIINEKLRAKMKELRIPSQQPYKIVITEQLNLLFGNSEKTYEYWNLELKKQINRCYPFGLLVKESSDTYSLKKAFDSTAQMCELFRRVSKIVRFQMTAKLQKEFETNPNSFGRAKTPFDDNDMEELVEGIKHTNIVSLSMGFYSLNKASSKVGEESVRMLNLAKARFQEALDSNPEDKSALRELASIECLLGNHDQAERNYLEAIQADQTDSISLFKYAEFLDKFDERSAEEYYLKALENDPSDEMCLRSYADFLRKNGNLDEADKFYELARRQSKASSIKEEEVFENRRRAVLGTDYTAANLLPSDHRGAWSTKEGMPKTKNDVKLPSNWEWTEEWIVDTTRPGVDENGWEYSLSWNSTWVAVPGTLTYVSRRRWKRVRRSVLLYLGEDEEVESIPIEDVIAEMKNNTSGLQLKDRSWYMKTYPQCFVGSDCVHFFMDRYSLTRKQALKLGNKLLTKRLIAHVENQHLFSDAMLYYHFTTPSERTQSKTKKFDEIKKEGYLEKQGAFVKSWKRRYFVLKKGTLYYYSKAQQVIPRGIISLVQANVVPLSAMKGNIGHTPLAFVASAFVIRTGHRNYIIKAKDSTEREEWMQAIEKNCI